MSGKLKLFKNLMGFSVVELLVAVFVIGIALAGIYSAFTSHFNRAVSLKHRLEADEMLREGMELVRNARDSKWASGTGGIGCPPYWWNNGNYTVEWGSFDLRAITLSTDTEIYKDPVGYNYHFVTSGAPGAGVKTIFNRKVEISNSCIPYPMGVLRLDTRVTGEVWWTEFGRTTSISAEEHLFNWSNL